MAIDNSFSKDVIERCILEDNLVQSQLKCINTTSWYPQKVSIVTVAYNKAKELPIFLSSIQNQSFTGDIEVVIVDDKSPSNDLSSIDVSQYPRLTIITERNLENKGNCYSRNVGISKCSGDLVFVLDCDCIPSSNWIEEHINTYNIEECDVVIGQMNVEHADPVTFLQSWHWADTLVNTRQGYQYPQNFRSFLNVVTRNVSFRRYIFEDLQFDENFSYSTSPDSGFGWEDVELGYQLYKKEYRIGFAYKCITIHISHPPQIPDSDKPLRSAKNFKRLFTKHPELANIARGWAVDTLHAILNWKDKYNIPDNDDIIFLKNLFLIESRIPIRSNTPLKILTYRWHVPHQYELYKLPHYFTLVTGTHEPMIDSWKYESRPFSLNARFLPIQKVNIKDYDLVILHFDENSLHPQNGFPLTKHWGETFRVLQKIAQTQHIPAIGVCHGTPQFYGQYTNLNFVGDCVPVIEKTRKELVELLKDIVVVCNSYQAQKEWGFYKSTVIWQGFDPSEFFPSRHTKGILTLGKEMEHRKHYRGYYIYKAVKDLLPSSITFDSISVETPTNFIGPTDLYGALKYWNYRSALREYSIYFNPTVRSPMPRSRGEAMMSGLVTVNYQSHDVDLFIQNGVNGFYSTSIEELCEYLQFLVDNPDSMKKMGEKSRETAQDLLNLYNYHEKWTKLLKEVTN